MSSRLSAAVKYASLGWGVIRLHHVLEDGSCSCRNADCTSIGKHPLDPQGASKPEHDVYTVQHLWEETPDANIGIVAGTSRLLILDLDSEDAKKRLFEIADEDTIALLARSPSVQTGRGVHIYLEDPTGGYSPSVGKDADHGIDIRAGVSYVVAPPSNHANGTTYTWRRQPTGTPEPPTPWLDNYIRNRYQAPARIYEVGDQIIEGNRNQALASLAGTMRRRGLTEAAIRAALLEENHARCNPPLTDREVEAIAHSVSKYAPQDVPLIDVRQDLATVARDIEDRGEAPRYVFLNEQEINELPDIDYLVDKLLPINGYGMVYGRRGSAKTFEMLHLALSVATGRDYRGHAVKHSGVAYIMSEGAAGLKKRLAAWKQHHDVAALDRFYALTQSVHLNDPELRAHLDLAIERIPTDVRLLIIDTLARSVAGLDENSSADMTRFIGYIDEIRQRRNVAIVIVHHAGWNEGHERGSTVIGDAADWICKISRDDDKIIVKTEKVKDDELPAKLTLELVPVGQTGSVVLDQPNEPVATDPKIVALCAFIHQHGEVTNEDIVAAGFSKDNAKKQYERHPYDFRERRIERTWTKIDGRDRVVWRVTPEHTIGITEQPGWTALDNDVSSPEAA